MKRKAMEGVKSEGQQDVINTNSLKVLSYTHTHISHEMRCTHIRSRGLKMKADNERKNIHIHTDCVTKFWQSILPILHKTSTTRECCIHIFIQTSIHSFAHSNLNEIYFIVFENPALQLSLSLSRPLSALVSALVNLFTLRKSKERKFCNEMSYVMRERMSG